MSFTEPQLPRLAGIEALRALAAIMVLFGHAMAEAQHYFDVQIALLTAFPWTRGVDIFFVISGFVIALSASRNRLQPFRFLRRRALRIVPLYYFFTTLMVAALLILPGGVKETQLDPLQILSSYGFLPYERADGRIAPVLSLGWTLNYEMFFYAIFALCLWLRHPAFWISMLLIALATLGAITAPENPQIAFWTNGIILEFGFGIGIAKLWMSGVQKPHRGLCASLIACSILGFIIMDQTELPRFIAAGIPATLLLVAGTLCWPKLQLPDLKLGASSYALYLCHRFVLRAGTILVLPFLPATLLGAYIYVFLVCIMSILLGLFTFFWLERPLMSWINDRERRTPHVA